MSSTIRITVPGRAVEWDVIDELAFTLLQTLVQNIGPATRDVEE